VLIVAPHPDDETAGCGGVACLHADAGDAVAVLVLTDGRGSRAGGLDPAAMAAVRAGEAHAAARTLGVAELELAGLPEAAWDLAEGAAAIARALAARRRAVVYLPSCVDYHPEHLRAAHAAAAALAATSPPPLVRVYETLVPLAGLVNCAADIDSVLTRKTMALACYASQRLGLAQVARHDRYTARLYGGGRAAEAFCEMSAPAYAAMVGAAAWPEGRPPFRGLRGRPLTDPFAYLVGRRARRLLREACG
jgi:LmbE family N-acetylglucosaminyl deacetylase